MAKKPPACRHSTSMMPPMKLDMSNLAWENSEVDFGLLPSPGGRGAEFQGFTVKWHISRARRRGKKRGLFFSLLCDSREKCTDTYMTEWFRGMFYSALMGIINV